MKKIRQKEIVVLLLLLCVAVCVLFVAMAVATSGSKKKTPAKKGNNNDNTATVLRSSGYIDSLSADAFTIDEREYQISNDSIKTADYQVNDKVSFSYQEKNSKRYLVKMKLLERKKQAEQPVTIASQVYKMSVAEKVGQMFFVRCPVQNVTADIQNYHLGGLIMFDENIQPFTKEQFIANNAAYQSASTIPLLIGLDEEGGTVNRLSWYTNYRATPFASPQEVYAAGGMDGVINDVKEKDALLKSVGVNVNFAPVADVARSTSDYIFARTFSLDAQQTADYITTVITTMNQDKEGSVLKHFPGYGNNANTHTGSAYDNRPYSDFTSIDFIPFEAGIKAGAQCVLVNHNITASIDNQYPSSLSLKVHQILRNDLKFDGVIITDDLAMDAIKEVGGSADVAVLAVEAGNDMLLADDYATKIPAVINAVNNGTIPIEQIDASVTRILKWKQSLGIYDPS